MTNYITNFVYVAATNTISVNVCDWSTQSHYLFAGMHDGWWLGIPLIVYWAVRRAVAPPRFPTSED
jgi:hypothetical protein